MFRFTIRDLLWLMVVVAMGIGWWDASRRALDREYVYKVWAFDLAAQILKSKTGDIIIANKSGVWVKHADGHGEGFRWQKK